MLHNTLSIMASAWKNSTTGWSTIVRLLMHQQPYSPEPNLVEDEAEGNPDNGMTPGTLWQGLPDDWKCLECGAETADFQLLQDV